MAESQVLSALGMLGSEIIKEAVFVYGAKTDLKKLESTFLTIKDVLEDAESRPIKKNDPLYKWLAKLKNAAYDTEDLLDSIQMEAERRKLEIHGHMIRGVREFFSHSNPIIFRIKISHKIKEMRERIVEISTERLQHHLEKREPKDTKMEVQKERETWSTPDETNICGREGDIETIVSILMETNNEADLLILPIVGIGGLGKTTLAQLVYNDERVKGKEQFELRSWVYVSEIFDPKRIARDAISSATGQSCNHDNLDSIGNQLKDLLREKKFLLVLDDVWNENPDEWEKLKPMLNVGRRGSRIIMTTRSIKVASIMGNTTPYKLKKLSNDDCWKLFKQRALGEESEEENPRLVEIGKVIVKKCGGVPLAAKALGSILLSVKEEEEWLKVRDNDIWKVTEEGNRVLASLRLSYTHLLPPVKQCFAYCSLFPKGYEFDKDTLISQWIAQGFVRSIDESSQMESTAKKYFNDLLRMSFLQDLQDNVYLGTATCKMHDLIHDLARSVAGDDVLVEEAEKAVIDLTKGYRYVTLMGYKPSTKVPANSLKKVRALHFLYNSEEDISREFSSILSSAKCLRTLDLSGGRIKVLPKLSNLRYLRASIADVEMLPEYICGLRNLQCLCLGNCESLRTVPESIGDLRNLRNLELTSCGGELQPFPDSFGNLQQLLLLDLSDGEMQLLPIKSFGGLQNLRSINLPRCVNLKELPDSIGDAKNLRSLNMEGCTRLQALPESMSSLTQLETLNITSCGALQELPRGLGNMQNLKHLNLSWCRDLKELPESIGNAQNLRSLNMQGCQSLRALPESMNSLTQLESLKVRGCRGLQELPRDLGNMRNLKHLKNDGCGSLRGMPRDMRRLLNLRALDLFAVGKQEDGGFSSIGELEHLNHIEGALTITHLERVRDPTDAMKANLKEKRKLSRLALSWYEVSREGDNDGVVLECLQPPPSIWDLKIHGYRGSSNPSWSASASLPNLSRLTLSGASTQWTGLRHLASSLQELILSNCRELHCLPASIRHLVSLQKLYLWDCENLSEIPEWVGELRSLRKLYITGGPGLKERCERERGEDWHKISHIPEIDIH